MLQESKCTGAGYLWCKVSHDVAVMLSARTVISTENSVGVRSIYMVVGRTEFLVDGWPESVSFSLSARGLSQFLVMWASWGSSQHGS